MENYCTFSKNHTCLKWLDYVITRQELEEADSLCHGNWIEIQRKNQYIQTLQEILDSNHISYPDEILVLCQDLVQVKMRNFSPF